MEQIEIRSEKVRNFIGDIPPMFVRLGTLMVFGILVLFLVVTYNVRYPFVIKVTGIVKDGNTIEVFVPYNCRSFVRDSLNVNVTVEGWHDNITHFVVMHVDDEVVVKEGSNYFIAYANMVVDSSFTPSLQKGLKVDASIIISNYTFWNYIFN